MANDTKKDQGRTKRVSADEKGCRLRGTGCCQICRNGPAASCDGKKQLDLTDEGYSSALRAIP